MVYFWAVNIILTEPLNKRIELLNKSEKDVKEKYILLYGLLQEIELDDLDCFHILKNWSDLEIMDYEIVESRLNRFKENCSYCESFKELKEFDV